MITAPRDGVVLRKLVEERELVPAGTPVLVFGESDRGYVVRAALADREIVNVKLGDKGEIRMDAFPGQAMTGTVVEVASAADERSGMFPDRSAFRFAAAAPGERPGGAAAPRARRPTRRRSPTCRWPRWSKATAIAPACSCSTAARRRRRDVRVAFITADSIALESGLAAGEPVITDGALYLENGEAVEMQRDATKQAVNPPRAGAES